MANNHVMGHRGCAGIFVEDVPYESLPHRCVPTQTCSICGLRGCFDYQDEEVEDRGILSRDYPSSSEDVAFVLQLESDMQKECPIQRAKTAPVEVEINRALRDGDGKRLSSLIDGILK